jgi:inner membrane protein
MANHWASLFDALVFGSESFGNVHLPFDEGIYYPISASAIHHPHLYKEAVVVKSILSNRPGRIYFENTWWTARSLSQEVLPIGTQVRVIGRDKLTLLVEQT